MDFGLKLTGFSADELSALLAPPPTEGQCDPDAVPEPPDEPTTQPGGLGLLGRHRLLCGDSSKPEDVDRLLDGAAIHLVNTDPPSPSVDGAVVCRQCGLEYPHHKAPPLSEWKLLPGKQPQVGRMSGGARGTGLRNGPGLPGIQQHGLVAYGCPFTFSSGTQSIRPTVPMIAPSTSSGRTATLG
jgi:hypothetical protein